MGINTFTIELEGITRSKSIYIKNPNIENGFWFDIKTNKFIKEATYGEKIKFTITTKDIDDDTIVNFTLYDYDGNYNPDDKLSRTFSAKVKNNVAELEFIPDIKWDESAKYEIDKVVEAYFKVETEIKGKKIEIKLPKKEDDYLKIYTPKVTLTIIIELPMSNYNYEGMTLGSKIAARIGLLGHTGIAIANNYYDYGPEKDQHILTGKICEDKYGDLNKDGDKEDCYKGLSDPNLKESDLNTDNIGSPYGTLGRPWWDKHFDTSSKKDINLDELISILDSDESRKKYGILGETYIFELDVTEEQAKIVENWWINKYNKELGVYSIDITEDGSHCTSTVRDSLIAAKLMPKDYLDLCIPSSFKDKIRLLRHTSGKYRGESIRMRILKDLS